MNSLDSHITSSATRGRQQLSLSNRAKILNFPYNRLVAGFFFGGGGWVESKMEDDVLLASFMGRARMSRWKRKKTGHVRRRIDTFDWADVKTYSHTHTHTHGRGKFGDCGEFARGPALEFARR